jgi:hypothetical protein
MKNGEEKEMVQRRRAETPEHGRVWGGGGMLRPTINGHTFLQVRKKGGGRLLLHRRGGQAGFQVVHQPPQKCAEMFRPPDVARNLQPPPPTITCVPATERGWTRIMTVNYIRPPRVLRHLLPPAPTGPVLQRQNLNMSVTNKTLIQKRF